MSAYESCSTHGNTEPCFLPKELDSYRWRVDDVSDDESEWKCDDDATVCDDDDVIGTNGEVSNPDDNDSRNVPDLCDLFE